MVRMKAVFSIDHFMALEPKDKSLYRFFFFFFCWMSNLIGPQLTTCHIKEEGLIDKIKDAVMCGQCG